MKQKIKSITEAFSMQPNVRGVTYEYNTPKEPKYFHNFIKEIRLERTEMVSFGVMQQYDVYRGYDYNGNKSFEYLANSVNVDYYYEEE
jgi:hypothetical protein